MTTTDPEYDRLRDAVVDAAMAFTQNRCSSDPTHMAAVWKSADALRDYRTKSSSPPPRVEPPEEHRHLRWHWLRHDEEIVPVEWFDDFDGWSLPGHAMTIKPEEAARWRYAYQSPCIPDTRTEKEKAAVAELMESQGLTEARVMRQALRHYQAHVHRLLDGETCTWSGDAARAEEFAGNAPSRIEVSEEATDQQEWDTGDDADVIRLARWFYDGLRAHFSPTQPATQFDFAAFVARKMAHSIKAFGPHQTIHGVCDHIRKELAEVEAAPEDRSEWIDVLLLAIDGAGRSGLDAEEIIAGMEAKLAKNEARQWPDWRTADAGKAIEHVRSAAQPAPIQQEITNEEIIGLGVSYHFIERNLGPYTIENFRFIECCRDLLAKYSPPLSNKTLDTLYDLAKTEEREQFKNDAKMVVGRKG